MDKVLSYICKLNEFCYKINNLKKNVSESIALNKRFNQTFYIFLKNQKHVILLLTNGHYYSFEPPE